MDEITIKVGIKIIESGRVFRIFKIEGEKIHYKPFFKNSTNRSVVCTIPRDNLSMTCIRMPATKDDVEVMLKAISKKVRGEPVVVDGNEAKNIFNLNDLHKTAEILRHHWSAKQEENGTTFSATKKRILQSSIERVTEEVACVYGLSLKKAEAKVALALG